jgi:transcriptional regulator with XRE-family HTH domain
MLAGVSVDYYTRLEQGRETNPSAQVIDALAHALEFDLNERRYAYALARIAWQPELTDLPAEVSAPLARMIDAWPHAACFVLDPLLDIVVLNRLARTLFEPFASTRNLVEMVFLDPIGRTFYADWERAASGCVANLRATSDLYAHHPRRAELLDRLEKGSPRFAELWAAHRVEPKTYDEKTLVHPEVGEIVVAFHALEVAAMPGHQLVVYQAEPASRSAERLALLAAREPVMLENA